MLKKIISLDKELFIYLNNLGSPTYDQLWLAITKQVFWLPLFLLLGYLLYKNLGLKNFGILLVFIAVLLFLSNTFVELSKTTFHRLRPCNNPDFKGIMRVVHQSNSFSFFSGHAGNSTIAMTFLFLILRKYYKYAFLVFLYPLLFAYSRIYLGVHYPLDILTGYVYGIVFGIIFYKFYKFAMANYFSPIKAL